MKTTVKVQHKNEAPSHVLGEPSGILLTLAFVDQEEAKKAGFKLQTSVTMTVNDEAGFGMGSEHTIEIKPAASK